MKKFKVYLLLLSLFLSIIPQPANADTLKDCRIPREDWAIVSLGFPLRSERLAKIKNPKILALPFQLKGEGPRNISQGEMSAFSSAIQNVKDFSSNLNAPEVVFSKPIEIPWTSNELDQIKINVSNTSGKDFSNSTYGFVEKVIKFSDSTIDYSGIDAVILYGNSSSTKQDIAEAMMFTSEQMGTNNSKRADGANWFDPLRTDEGLISNVALIYNNPLRSILTHELMHLYGLTDLYGSASGPGVLSLMDSNKLNLLTYEKWILGWHPDNQVKCLSKVSPSALTEFSLEFKNYKEVMIITSATGASYVVETLTQEGNPTLAFYTVENNQRPPLTLFKDTQSRTFSDIQLATPYKIGAQLISPEFTLLISDVDSERVTLNLIGNSQASSAQFKELLSRASTTRDTKVKEFTEREKILAEAKAVADLKAKQEAEAKAVADLKAKQEAEAKAVASMKTTVTCTKGKVIKKVTGTSPKCPAGYKKK